MFSRIRRISRSEEHTSELQSRQYLVCRLLLEKKKQHINKQHRRMTIRSLRHSPRRAADWRQRAPLGSYVISCSLSVSSLLFFFFFFFNDTATTEIYTLSLHDALPIWNPKSRYLNQAYGPYLMALNK